MNSRERVVRLGVDIGKNSFHLWGVNEQDERVVKKKVHRCVLLREVANLPACLIGMEGVAVPIIRRARSANMVTRCG